MTVEPAPSDAGLAATASDAVYLGQSLRYHLDLAGKTVIATSTDRGARFAAGAPVRLTWRPDDVRAAARPSARRSPLLVAIGIPQVSFGKNRRSVGHQLPAARRINSRFSKAFFDLRLTEMDSGGVAKNPNTR
jgi:hypothetical protein